MIKLGMVAKDKITGFKGVVDHIVYYPYSCRQVCIKSQKLDKDGSTIEAEMFDEPQLEIINKKPIILSSISEQKFEFGQKVKDRYTGFTGKVAGRAIYLNGCVRLCIQPEFTKTLDKDYARGMWFPEGQLDVIGKLIKKTETETTTGGPTNKITPFMKTSKK